MGRRDSERAEVEIQGGEIDLSLVREYFDLDVSMCPFNFIETFWLVYLFKQSPR